MAKRPDRTRPTPPVRPLISPINVSALKTYPLQKRRSKVQVSDFAQPWQRGGSFARFYENLPNILAVKSLRAVTQAIAGRRGIPGVTPRGLGGRAARGGAGRARGRLASPEREAGGAVPRDDSPGGVWMVPYERS